MTAAPTLYTGIHVLSFAPHLEHAMVSLNLVERRRNPFPANHWILDSGAFTRISRGIPHLPVVEYAEHIDRLSDSGTLDAAVQQDWMCEQFILDKTGMTVREHQHLTTENYLNLRERVSTTYVMPVIQGFEPDQYAQHVADLSPDLEAGAWVGVGSVCKRQGSPYQISAVLTAILDERPDLNLHGFGVKSTALRHGDIWMRFHSVDSMAWSFAGRFYNPSRSNDLSLCLEWTDKVQSIQFNPSQARMPF